MQAVEPHAESTPADDAALRPLDPRAIRLWRTALLLPTAAATLALVAASAAAAAGLLSLEDDVLPRLLLAAVGVSAVGLALAAFLPPARYRAWRFQVRDDDVLIRQGVFWHTTSLVPHSRIQHVDTLRGPLERWLGLARVVIYTAGTRGARLTIPALAVDEAEALRDRLALLGGRGDAV
jgi:membrane protein YdbS with pleckstrin-like domain